MVNVYTLAYVKSYENTISILQSTLLRYENKNILFDFDKAKSPITIREKKKHEHIFPCVGILQEFILISYEIIWL